jgi:hypothetical protein
MARIEQQKADQRALQLLEKHKVCTSFLFLVDTIEFSFSFHAPQLIWVPKLKTEREGGRPEQNPAVRKAGG